MTLSKTLAACLLLLPQVSGHVLLEHPAPRVPLDTVYDDSCAWRAGFTCPSYCGGKNAGARNLNKNYPVTELPVGEPILFEWYVKVAHRPYQYRISLNAQGTGDANFDLEENRIALTEPFEYNGFDYDQHVNGTYTIPESMYENCKDPSNPCSVQLWDAYYFVSCADVVLVKSEGGDSAGAEGTAEDASTPTSAPSSAPTSMPSSTPTVFRWPEDSSIMLADKTGEPNGLGFCLDLEGSIVNDTIRCRTVHGGSCDPGNVGKSFGYTDNLTMPYIYATHHTGWKSSCYEILANDTSSKQACLTAIVPEQNPSKPEKLAHIRIGAKVGLYRCDNLATQRFRYHESGQFQIIEPNNNRTFCLGMAAQISNATWGMGVERRMELMSCANTTDPSLITWTVTPEPKNPVKEASVAVQRSAIFDRRLRAGKHLRHFDNN